MKSDYQLALRKCITYMTDLKSEFIEIEKYELMQVKQFQSFTKFLDSNVKDDDFEQNLDDFLKLNEYIDTEGKFQIKLMLEQLFDGLDDFDKWSEHFKNKFLINIKAVSKSGGFFSEALTPGMINSFLDSIQLLNAVRVKCLCYVAIACVLKISFGTNITSLELKNLMKSFYGINAEVFPTKLTSLKYVATFYNSLFIYSN